MNRTRTSPSPSSARALVDFDLAFASQRIVNGALGVAAGERVLVLVDRAREALGAALVHAIESAGGKPALVILEEVEETGEARDQRLAKMLEEVEASVLLLGAEQPVSLRVAFVTAVERLGVRHAHLVGLSRRAFGSGFAAEPGRVAESLRAVHRRLLGKTLLSYRTPAGTNLQVKLSGDARWFERGELIRPGKWANLPGGQVLTLPESVDGTFVADASTNVALAGSADLRSRPVHFTIEKNVITAVTSPDAEVAQATQDYLRLEERLDHVGQVTLGTNPGLSAPIGEVIYDQCVPGVHLVFGWTHQSVTGASWSTNNVLAMNGSGGDLDVDGEALLRGGRYML